MSSSSIRPSRNAAAPRGADDNTESGADINLGERDSLPDGSVRTRPAAGASIKPRRSGRGGGSPQNAAQGYNDSRAVDVSNDRNAVPDEPVRNHEGEPDETRDNRTEMDPDSANGEPRASAGHQQRSDYRRHDPSDVRSSGPVRGDGGRKRDSGSATTGMGRGEG